MLKELLHHVISTNYCQLLRPQYSNDQYGSDGDGVVVPYTESRMGSFHSISVMELEEHDSEDICLAPPASHIKKF